MAANATVALSEWRFREPSILPGFGLTFGFSMAYLSFIVLIPLGALLVRALGVPFEEMVQMVTDPRVLASLRLSFGASLLAATINAFLGLALAWSLTRYEFPGACSMHSSICLSPCRQPSRASRS
jgi:sulfate transport system permease protein